MLTPCASQKLAIRTDALTSRDRQGADGRDTRTTACSRRAPRNPPAIRTAAQTSRDRQGADGRDTRTTARPRRTPPAPPLRPAVRLAPPPRFAPLRNRAATVRERMVVTPVPPHAHARGSQTPRTHANDTRAFNPADAPHLQAPPRMR